MKNDRTPLKGHANLFIIIFFGFLTAIASLIPIILPGILAFLAALAMRRSRYFNYGSLYLPCFLGLLFGASIPVISFFMMSHEFKMDRTMIIFLVNIASVIVSYLIGLLVAYRNEVKRQKII